MSGIISHKIVFFIIIAIRTWNLTFYTFLFTDRQSLQTYNPICHLSWGWHWYNSQHGWSYCWCLLRLWHCLWESAETLWSHRTVHRVCRQVVQDHRLQIVAQFCYDFFYVNRQMFWNDLVSKWITLLTFSKKWECLSHPFKYLPLFLNTQYKKWKFSREFLSVSLIL